MKKSTRLWISLGFVAINTVILFLKDFEIIPALSEIFPELDGAYIVWFCQFLLFLNFDTLADYKNFFIKILRGLIYIIVLLLLLFMSGMTLLALTVGDGVEETLIERSAWHNALYMMVANSGLFCYLMFKHATKNEWSKSVFPFIPTISSLLAYLTQVVIASLCKINTGFKCLNIIMVILIVISPICKRIISQKIGNEQQVPVSQAPFMVNEKDDAEGGEGMSAPPISAKPRESTYAIRQRVEYNIKGRATQYIVHKYNYQNVPKSRYRLPICTSEWEPSYPELSIWSTDVKLTGNISFSAPYTYVDSQYQLEKYEKECAEDAEYVREVLLDHLSSIVQGALNEEEDYDEQWNIEVEISYTINIK